MREKHITYKPDWRLFRFQLLLSLTLIPFIVGIPLFAYFILKKRNISYIISDVEIKIRDVETVTIPVIDILEINLTVLPLFLGKQTGNIVLKTPSGTFTLKCLYNYQALYDVLSFQLLRLRTIKQENNLRDRLQVKADPGSLERLNDLLGMWQQGIISDYDYWAERKKFEK